MFDLVVNSRISSGIDWANILAMLITGFLTAGVAIGVAFYNNEKQIEIFNKQVEEQKKQWKYDTLLKTKIETLFEFRKLFLKFQRETICFIGLFLPDLLSRKDKTLNPIDYYNMNTDEIIPHFLNSKYYDSFEEILLNNFRTANKLYELLSINDIFLNNLDNLRTEPITFVKGFLDFYIDLIISKKYSDSILVKKDENIHEIKYSKEFNEYFLKFMHMRLPYTINNVRTHVFFMIEPSIFSVNKQCYTDENVKVWATNFKILYSVSCSIKRWLAITMKDIDKIVEKYIPIEEIEVFSEKI